MDKKEQLKLSTQTLVIIGKTMKILYITAMNAHISTLTVTVSFDV